MNIEQLKQYKLIDLLTIINEKNKIIQQLKEQPHCRNMQIKDLKAITSKRQDNEIAYEAYYSKQDGLHFRIDNKHLWETREGYRYAELINNHYCNYETFTDLEQGLLKLRYNG